MTARETDPLWAETVAERGAEWDAPVVGGSQAHDLIGLRFGSLRVLVREGSDVTPSGQKKATWRCLCDCGNESVVRSQPLTRGETKSCGCRSSFGINDEGMVGARFGRWLVVQREGSLSTAAAFRCVCDCGTERLVRGHLLRSGATQSCGCLAVERATAAKVKPIVKYLSAHDRVRKARGRAKKHSCVDCGGRADEWSYNGGDPDELTELVHGRHLLAYSLDIYRYSPRCVPCHRKFDARKDTA